jgi:hypothetical protein
MRAVWSFWSKPFQVHKYEIWCKPLHHLLAWGLSVQTAQRHYPETMLITDRPGKKLLVEQLGLPFVHVSTELDRLANVDSGWWALGKLVAYSMQDQPFVHIDSDVFLWKPLPSDVVAAPVFAQCPEFHANDCYDSPESIERAFADHRATLPAEWEWARSKGDGYFREENCGILGGSQLDFLRYYARTAIELVLGPENAAAWAALSYKTAYNMIVIEQFFLSACIGFHRFHPTSRYRGVQIKHLFSSWDEASNANQAARMGYTHLMGGAKSVPAVGRRLEERVRRDDPAYFRRCEKILTAIS